MFFGKDSQLEALHSYEAHRITSNTNLMSLEKLQTVCLSTKSDYHLQETYCMSMFVDIYWSKSIKLGTQQLILFSFIFSALIEANLSKSNQIIKAIRLHCVVSMMFLPNCSFMASQNVTMHFTHKYICQMPPWQYMSRHTYHIPCWWDI